VVGFTHGKTAVSIGFIGTSIFGSKDDVGVWKEVLKAIFSGGEENPIILSLMVGKNSRQCEAFGEIGGYSFAKHCR